MFNAGSSQQHAASRGRTTDDISPAPPPNGKAKAVASTDETSEASFEGSIMALSALDLQTKAEIFEADCELARALQHEGHLGAPDDASVASAATTAQALPRPPHLDGDGFVIDNSPQRGTGSDSVARAEAGIAQLAKKLSTVRNGEYLRSLLTGSTSRLLSSARPAAVAKSIEFIAQKVSSEIDTPCCAADGLPLCGWPVRSINEWGVSQDRVLVLTPRALWRVDYDEAWGKVDHHSRVGLEAIVNVRPKEGGPSSRGVGGNNAHPATTSGGGFVISLSQRDGRKNPLMPLLSGMRSARRPSSARGGAAAGASTTTGPSVATRTYYAVGPIGLSTTAVREGMLMAIEAARAVLVAEGSYSLGSRMAATSNDHEVQVY